MTATHMIGKVMEEKANPAVNRYLLLRKPQKVLFLVVRPRKPSPPPFEPNGHSFVQIFLASLKKFFFLSGPAFTPPLPLYVVQPLKL